MRVQRPNNAVDCPRCQGAGCFCIADAKEYPDGSYRWSQYQDCAECDGRGWIVLADTSNYRITDPSVAIREVCHTCYYLNPAVTDPGMRYRCRVSGGCPAAQPRKEVV